MQKEMGGLNKKGQEGVTLTTLLLIILGIVVVVVVILGFTGAFGFIFGKVDVLPGQDLQAVVTSCEIAGANGLKADYCFTFKEVELDGQKQYVNCEDDRVKSAIDGTKISDPIECGDSELAKKYCGTLKSSKGDSFKADKTYVNGKTCEVLGLDTLDTTEAQSP